jgi:hypothetical protein
MTLTEFQTLSADWPLSEPFRYAILTAIKKDRNHIITYSLEDIDKRWCSEHGFQIKEENDKLMIEL